MRASPKLCPGISEVVALKFDLTATYTLAVVAAARHPDGLVGQSVNRWIMATDRILGLLLGGPLAAGRECVDARRHCSIPAFLAGFV